MVTVGKKGDLAMRRLRVNVVASFAELRDKASLSWFMIKNFPGITEIATLDFFSRGGRKLFGIKINRFGIHFTAGEW